MRDDNIFTESDSKLYLLVFSLMVIISGAFDLRLALLSILVYSYLIYHTYDLIQTKDRDLRLYIEDLSEQFESATKYAIFNMPFPLIMLDDKGSINWYNTPFLDMIEDEEDILNKDIREVLYNINIEELEKLDEGEALPIEYGEKDYLVYHNHIMNKKSVTSGKEITLLYLVDNTDYIDLVKRYEDRSPVVAMIQVDNYDDVKSNTPDVSAPMVMAEIDSRIRDYFVKYKGLIRKYDNSRYIAVMDSYSLEKYQDEKFAILDEMRELDIGNKIPITLSMGVSTGQEDLGLAQKDAVAAIEIALGRGGDQVVVNKDGNLDFYGGKSKAMEKRNKVKARVIGYALKQLITQSDKVFIMGHTNGDMDSYGSSIGVLRGVKNVGRDGYIVLNDINPSINNIHDRLKEVQPELLDDIITSAEAKDLMTEDSLLILVDNHKPSFTEAPELVEELDKVVIIDHHRRGAEFVKDPVLTYLEPYASSASELVTEILAYMSDDIGLTKFEAEALLAGITVDTKNFSFQTGVRTFEAASSLKRAGADTTSVRQFFRDDYNMMIEKSKVISSSEIVAKNIAIGILDLESEASVLLAAQSANQLLDINDMEASFVLTHSEGKIHISGRSLGKISVQLILESLGGGGHLTSAGAQLEDVSLEEAKEELKEAIMKYIKDGGE